MADSSAEQVAKLSINDDAAPASIATAEAAAAAAAAATVDGGAADGAAAPEKKQPREKKDKAPKEPKAAKEPKPAQQPKPKGSGGGAADGGKKKETLLGMKNLKSGNFGEWYSELVVASELISYYDVSGCYILRPWAFAMWEVVQRWFDDKIKASGVENAYFPLFITEDVLNKEKDHVEGFAPEVAWVTRYGNSEMEKPIAIRPTSETVMYPYFAQWIRSHRDLPLRLNQWTNVVRWEFKYPTPFIRSREFLWQEGHTAFATKEEADAEVLEILDLYSRVYEEILAVPVIKGKKSAKEQFAGALYTTTVEAFIPETGKGIQGATSHCLGQNFSKMFNIEYEEGTEKKLAWQNSWGLTTRSIGVMIMTHADDKGLVLPPRVAPKQVVIIPIPKANTAEDVLKAMTDKTDELRKSLESSGVRVTTDARNNYTPGWKYNHYELKGVPLRVELGPKDMDNSAVVVARRDTGAKEVVSWADFATRVPALLQQVQDDMFAKAKASREFCTERVTTWEGFMTALTNKHMALAPWCDEPAVEDDVKKRSVTADAMGAKTLCIPFDQPELPEGTLCFASGKPAKNWALWGRSY